MDVPVVVTKKLPDPMEEPLDFLRALGVPPRSRLETSGPEVDELLIRAFLVQSLTPDDHRRVSKHCSRYKAWAEKLDEIKACRPEINGPPVNEAVMARYLSGEALPAERRECLKNIYSYRNWYDRVSRD